VSPQLSDVLLKRTSAGPLSMNASLEVTGATLTVAQGNVDLGDATSLTRTAHGLSVGHPIHEERSAKWIRFCSDGVGQRSQRVCVHSLSGL